MSKIPIICISFTSLTFLTGCQAIIHPTNKRPNILIAISDDQSFAHTSFAGSRFVNTPAFDRIAQNGTYFTNCIASSPGCAPSRSSLVTGRYHWQNEQSGQHASSWLKKFIPFTDILETGGYFTGFTGKGIGPFQYARSEADSLWRILDAAGNAYNSIRYGNKNEFDERPAKGIDATNYFANFVDFMQKRKSGQPFFFWYGAKEPHRDYEDKSWMRFNKSLDMVDVPGFLPDNDTIKGDMLDYAIEIEWFDFHLGLMLNYLDSIGELENTIVIVTSDNGMPFPRVKANCYEYGVHVPLAINYPNEFPGSRIVNDPISFADFAPTILELAKISSDGMKAISGRSFVNILKSKKSGIVDETKQFVFSGRERHSSSRWNNLGYPQRSIRSTEHLLIWNMKPNLWPAGDPQAINPDTDTLLPMFGIDKNGLHHSNWAFTDVDASPSKSYLVEKHNNSEVSHFFNLAFEKRPEFELYNIVEDPYCLNNVYENAEYFKISGLLKDALLSELKKSEDPRIVGPDKEIFDKYIRYSPMRVFPQP